MVELPQIEKLVLQQAAKDDEYARMVYAVLVPDLFTTNESKSAYKLMHSYYTKHGHLPSKSAMMVRLETLDTMNEDVFRSTKEVFEEVFSESEAVDSKWLLEETEKWAQERAVYNAIYQSIEVLDGRNKKLTKNAIPDILQKALQIGFDKDVGHDYLVDASRRYEYYHNKENKIPFKLKMLNKITGGGLPRKTVACIIAPTGKGKSIWLCDEAAHHLMEGRNVIYITLELQEEVVAKRIDANLLNVRYDQVDDLTLSKYDQKIEELKAKTNGKLLIRQYPSSTGNCNHFRFLIKEAKLKYGFKPDVVIIDYVNICASANVGDRANTYVLIKNIAEEIRALAIEEDVLALTASQTNRAGMTATDYDVTEVAESTGLSHTVDFMIAMIQTEEMEKLNTCRLKQLKNRFGSLVDFRSFLVGIEKAFMRFYDLDNPAPEHGPMPDTSSSTTLSKPTSDGKKNYDGFVI